MIKKTCKTCGKNFEVHPYRRNTAKSCSLDCRPQAFKKGHPFGKRFKKGHPKPKNAYTFLAGKKHPFYKGKYKCQGYVYISKPSHPRADRDGYVKQANLVMEKLLGRYLIPPELVHHKGIKYPLGSIKNRQDDRPENLQLFANHSTHIKFHHKISWLKK